MDIRMPVRQQEKGKEKAQQASTGGCAFALLIFIDRDIIERVQ